MSSLVLARKYRPKNFTEMVGQGTVVQALSNALETQHLHHAYLFTGTRGVGKTTISRILAKSLNCIGPDGQGGITAKPCGVCAMCTAIDEGRFVDYTELDAASNRSVDEVQSLLEQAAYKPVEGRFKVFMIDEVHMLTNHAFNAMLKTLEEPPPYLMFVLATTDPQKIPVTVLSRCLQFNLRPMAPETVQEHLSHVLAAEGVAVETGALRLLAKAAHGSMRDALSLTDQALAFGAGQLQEAAVREMLGAVDDGAIYDMIAALAQGNGQALLGVVDNLRSAGLSAAYTLESMALALQTMAVYQVVPPQEADLDPNEQILADLAKQLPADETQLLYSLVIHGRAELGLAPDEYAGLTMALLRLFAFKPAGFRPGSGPLTQPPSAQVDKKKITAEPLTSTPPTPTPVAPVPAAVPEELAPELLTPPAPPAEVPAAITLPVREMSADSAQLDQALDAPADPKVQQAWLALVDALQAGGHVQALAQQLACQSECVQQADGWLRLRVEQSALQGSQVTERLEASLAKLGQEWRLRVELGPVQNTWAMRHSAAIQAAQEQAEAAFLALPVVQHLQEHWQAKVLPDSIRQHTPADTDPAA